jgi:hypothetical protein
MKPLRVRLSLNEADAELIGALAELLAAIEYADQVMLEDSIRDAHQRLVVALRHDIPVRVDRDV